MKTTITIISLLFAFYAKAQLFTGSGGNIQNNGVETYFDLSVSGLPAQMTNTFGVEEVCINIIHPKVEELYIYLQSPSGIVVELTEGRSEEHTSELQSLTNLVCRLLLEKKTKE